MSRFHRSSYWAQVVGGLAIGIAVSFLMLYVYDVSKPPFATIQSPDSSYTVNLYGQKERPALFTVEVGVIVLKKGETFWSYQTLHTGDAFDISFELGWPDHRWIGDNVLQLYREENFSGRKYPEILILANKSDKAIRQLRIESNNDKFLGFDLLPDTEIRLTASPPKGDSSTIWIVGMFDDGLSFEKSAFFDGTHMSGPQAFNIVVTDEGVTIDKADTIGR